jgi:hypothetical protein
MAVPTSGAAEAEVCAGAGDEVAGHIGKSLVAVAGVIAQQGEGLVHIHPETLGELPLGLLDDNPAAKGCLELLGDGLPAAHVPLVQQPDGRDIGQCLADAQLCRVEQARGRPEQLQQSAAMNTMNQAQRPAAVSISWRLRSGLRPRRSMCVPVPVCHHG